MSETKTQNINSTYFEGSYKDFWRTIFPEKTTIAEVDFIIAECKLDKNTSILDLMCGYGRHSIELARRGINVTAIDNLREYVDEIRARAKKDNLDIECIHSDVLELNISRRFDAVICMGNSLQFFNGNEIKYILSRVSNNLKENGKLIINTWSIAEIAFKNFVEKSWGRINETILLSESSFAFRPTRIETKTTFISKDLDIEEKKSIDYIFSISEMEQICANSGFDLEEVFSVPGKKKFSLGDPRAYIVARKANL